MNDSHDWSEAVIRLREPMTRVETDVAAKLEKLGRIDAVIFDIYGTLVISGSGDVGSADETDRGLSIGEAMAAVGWFPDMFAIPRIEDLHEQIRISNEQRNEACPKPEVDITEI